MLTSIFSGTACSESGTCSGWPHSGGGRIRALVGLVVIYNLAAGGICLAGKMNPLLAAILMRLSSVVTLGLALPFLRLTDRVR